jgi:hypothetical protein
MKVDKRKKYVMVLDVETANSTDDKKHNDGLVYDIGFTIIDKKGNIYAERSFCIKEIFDWIELMNSAYYANKRPIYYNKMKNKEMEKVTIWEARQRIKKALEYFGITEVYAYNAYFDYTTLNNTVRYISGSGCRWFLPYGVEVCDIWHIACQILGTQKLFQSENVRNDKGNLITSAERIFAYMEQNPDFEESHTGLEDARIESQILARCLRTHKHIDKRINRACWRIPQKI